MTMLIEIVGAMLMVCLGVCCITVIALLIRGLIEIFKN